MATTLQRQTFQTSRLLEYFSEKELTLQTGHEPDRWREVILKELIDNALDACEAHDILPDITVLVTDDRIVVTDNGPGLTPDVVDGVLDFSVRVSSKDFYVSPTRGQQGNALKTVLAIPYVLDGRGLVTVTARGTRHTLQVAVNRLAGRPEVQHEAVEDASVKTGTRVEVSVAKPTDDDEDAVAEPILPIVARYALLNPHASFALCLQEGCEPSQQAFPRRVEACTKWKPSAPTSPHWYTPDQLRDLIAAYVTAEPSGRAQVRTVRDFVGEFRGLSSTVKRKTVLADSPFAGQYLHDLVVENDVDPAAVSWLCDQMKAASLPVPPLTLGVLGEPHFRAWLTTSGAAAPTFRYKRIAAEDEETGLPFVLEVAFAGRQDDEPRTLITGLNFSPTLINPFRSLCGDFSLGSLLESLHVSQADPVTLVVHLVAPGLRFTDRGKSSLEDLDTIGQAIIEAVSFVTKPWSALKKKELRADRRDQRQRAEYYRRVEAQEWSVKEAAYHVMREAYAMAAGQIGLALARMVFYAARPLMQELTAKPLDSKYFTQTLLPAYQADYPNETAGWDVVYDARGHLHEPHTAVQVDLGTLDVRKYLSGAIGPSDALRRIAPSLSTAIATTGSRHRYSTVLFIEKEGFFPLFERARIAERYDLAIMSTKGVSNTAARTLMEGLPVRFLCLHDFDKAGFSIVGTLTRNTGRYRFRVPPEVVDLGLRLIDVQTESLAAESCSYGDDKDPAKNLRLNGATEDEIDFLLEDGGQRVELNAFTSDRFIAWLEPKLEAAGVVKLIPDDDTLKAAYQRAIYIHAMNSEIKKLHEAADAKASEAVPPVDLRQSVEDALADDNTQAWDAAVADLAGDGDE